MSLIAGLAKSINKGLTFNRVSRAPLLERTDLEPYSILTAPLFYIVNQKKFMRCGMCHVRDGRIKTCQHII